MTDRCSATPDVGERAHCNTLAARPALRISLRLGRIEYLFEDEPNTPRGRMARLQVLGLFYWPLDDEHSSRAFAVCWKWVKEEIFHVESDEEADDKIQSALRERVISQADASLDKLGTLRRGLPPPASGEAKEENFAKIRLPGGFTFIRLADIPPALNPTPEPKRTFEFGADAFRVEDEFYRRNRVLGKIPIVAVVERRVGDGWVAAPEVPVFFRLVPTDPIPYLPGRPDRAQLDRPPMALTGPWRRFFAEELRFPRDSEDPQSVILSAPRTPGGKTTRRHNCPADRGGKWTPGRDTVAGTLFDTESAPGFHLAHGRRSLPHPPYPKAERAPAPHRHAVVCKTNSQGKAGLILRPSRAGGDCYRIRACVGSPDRPEAVAETGTLVVWRNIRISRYIRHEINPQTKEDFGIDLPAANFSDPEQVDPTPGVGGSFVRQYARSFCEIELDWEVDCGPEPLTQPEWEEARKRAFEYAERGIRPSRFRFDIKLLFQKDESFPVASSPNLIPMQLPLEYNLALRQLPRGQRHGRPIRTVGNDFPTRVSKGDRDAVMSFLDIYVYSGFFAALSRDGLLPGLTIVQGADLVSWYDGVQRFQGLSGIVTAYRGAFVVGSTHQYAFKKKRFTDTVCHEIGHALYRDHAPDRSGEKYSKKGARAGEHDPVRESLCLMSYNKKREFFCGKCLYAFRGWDVAAMGKLKKRKKK